MKTFFQHLIATAGETIKPLIAGVATGACFFILYHGVCLGAEWLFDIPVTFDQRFLIEAYVIGSFCWVQWLEEW